MEDRTQGQGPRGPHSDTTVSGLGRQPVRLRVQVGEGLGRSYTMSGDSLTIGRSQDSDLVLDDPQVSRNHARLTRKGNTLLVEDLGSTNGTLVNGRRITGPHSLQPTETIAIGSTVFSVEGFSAPNTLGIRPVRPASADTRVGQIIEPESATPWLVIGGIAGLFVVVLLVIGIGWFLSQQREEAAPAAPYVFIQSPVAGSRVQVGDTVFVNAVASDTLGVTRAELWVGGLLVDQQESAVSEGQPTFPVSLEWTPTTAGNYTLEVKVYNSKDVPSAPTTVMVVVENGPLPPATPTPTPEPTSSEPTPGGSPVAVTTYDLNVREGPGQVYGVLDLLPVGTEMQISGKDAQGMWWQIVYPPNSGGRGWVYAPFTRANNVDDVPVVEAPPLPTATVTATVAPTNTPVPTLTLTPVTAATPTPTPSPTVSTGPVVDFWSDTTNVDPGQCVTLQWHIENVSSAFLTGGEFNNLGVTGPYGSRNTCPVGTTLYALKAETSSGLVEKTVIINMRAEKTVTIGVVGGSVRQDGQVRMVPLVGDDQTNRALRAFLGFDLNQLKGKRIVDAKLDLSNYVLTGNPFGSLGILYVEEVNLVSAVQLNSGSYSMPATATLATFDGSAGLVSPVDVTNRIGPYVDAQESVYPVRMRFQIETNNNNADDYVNWSGARLTVRYYD